MNHANPSSSSLIFDSIQPLLTGSCQLRAIGDWLCAWPRNLLTAVRDYLEEPSRNVPPVNASHDENPVEALKNLVSEENGAKLRTRLQNLLEVIAKNLQPVQRDRFVEPYVELIRGPILVSLALIHRTSENDRNQYLQAALRSYRTAWPFRSDTLASAHHKNQHSIEGTLNVVESLLFDLTEGTSPKTTFEWLLLRRLIDYLLNGDPASKANLMNTPSAKSHNDLGLMMVRKDGLNGYILNSTIDCSDEGCTGYYVDPIETGLLAIDKDFWESLYLGWRVCKNEQPIASRASIHSIRIAVPRSSDVWGIGDASASGPLAISMIATAQNKTIDKDVLGTFALRIKDSPSDGDESPVGKDRLEITSVNHETISAKLSTAEVGAKKAKRKWRVLVHPDQEINNSGSDSIGKDIEVFRPSSFASALLMMTGDAEKEERLRTFCGAQVKAWEEYCKKHSMDRSLDRFQPSTFSQNVKPTKADGDPKQLDLPENGEKGNQTKGHEYKQLCPSHETIDEKYTKLFNLSNRILLSEDAGAGKTIFMQSAAAWLSQPSTWSKLDFLHAKPCLAVVFGVDGCQWPMSEPNKDVMGIYKDLITTIVKRLVPSDPNPTELVEYAIDNHRLILLMDAFDQLSGNEGVKRQEALEEAQQVQTFPARIVVTSRPPDLVAQRSKEGMFSSYEQVRLDGFSPWQQWLYFEDLLETVEGIDHHALEELRTLQRQVHSNASVVEQKVLDDAAKKILESPEVFGSLYQEIADYLRSPVILQFIRGLVDPRTRTFPKFNSRADLYYQANASLLKRNIYKAYGKSGADLGDITSNFVTVLSTLAYVMMSEGLHDAYAPTLTDYENVRNETNRRLPANIDRIWYWNELDSAGWLSKAQVFEDGMQKRLCWKHRSMMEFYCGLFLAKNQDPNWIFHRDQSQVTWMPGDFRLYEFASSPQWAGAFRFAMELPYASNSDAKTFADPQTRAISLSTLFSRPIDVRRPTQLMWDIWGEVIVAAQNVLLSLKLLDLPQDNRRFLTERLCKPFQQCECLLPLRETTYIVQHWVRNVVDNKVEQLQNAAKWPPNLTRSTRKGVLQPVAGYENNKSYGEKNLRWACEQILQDVPEWLQEAIESDRKWIQEKIDQGDFIHFATAFRYLSEHRWIYYGVKGPTEAEEQDVMKSLESGFRTIPKCKPEEFQNDPEGKLLRTWMGDDSRLTFGDEDVFIAQVDGPFALHEHSVTNQLYRLFDKVHVDQFSRRKYSPEDDCPVIDTSLYDCWMASIWFGSALPDEIQWEFGCRAQVWRGDTNPEREVYWFKDSQGKALTKELVDGMTDEDLDAIIDKHAWTDRNSEGKVRPVGKQLHNNGFDLYDMSGNVWERTLSPYSNSAKAKMTGAVVGFVVRGGSWFHGNHGFFRSSYRYLFRPVSRRFSLGFRLCRDCRLPLQSS